MTPLAKLIFDALTFADLAVGEGIGLLNPKTGKTLFAEDFIMDYLRQYDAKEVDEVYLTLAQRVADRVAMMERLEQEYLNRDIIDGNGRF